MRKARRRRRDSIRCPLPEMAVSSTIAKLTSISQTRARRSGPRWHLGPIYGAWVPFQECPARRAAEPARVFAI